MAWEALLTDDGSWTMRHGPSGATCHSTAGAWTQARERYAGPCRLAELGEQRGVVHLLDIGTGIGLNLAAALDELEPGHARLEVLSLELDPAAIEAGLALGPWPAPVDAALERVRPALARAVRARDGERVEFASRGALASCGELASRGGLRLWLGDARERAAELGRERFDAVFLDPFAPRDAPDLWEAPFLAQVARAMAPHAILSTYSASLEVRARLAAAGLRIGLGPRVGRKAQGTLASFTAPLPELHPRLQRRISRRSDPPTQS
jgi:tRNA U34 5-methylaminomethyl-2-thiouridine-forming methyltransferase MnmC